MNSLKEALAYIFFIPAMILRYCIIEPLLGLKLKNKSKKPKKVERIEKWQKKVNNSP